MRFGAMVQPNIGDPDLPREIERLGFDSLWIPDSHMIASDCYAVMALAAMNTSRIRIGTGVSIAGTRIAPVTAHSIATINRIAPGRVFLGLGTGHTAMRTMGYDPVPPREFREYVRVTCELLRTGESDFTWRGKTRHIQFMHRQLGLIDLETPIPVLVAANGPKALEIAGEFGDGRVSADNEPAELMPASQAAIREAARRVGRTLPTDYHAATLAFACVMRPGETLRSERVIEQAGPMSVAYLRYWYEWYKKSGTDALIPRRDPQRVGRVSRARQQAPDPGRPALSRASRRSLHLSGPVRAALRHAQRDPRRARLRGRARRDHRTCSASASARACTRSRSCRRSTARARSSATSPNRSSPATSMANVAAAVIELIEALGVRRAYGLTGGPIAPFCDQLGRSGIEAMHCRHESGAAFAALEDSLASGLPAAVFVTTGPGVTNALTGMCAARWEGGRVLLISACTPAREMGRRAFQETSDATLPAAGMFQRGPIFDDAWRVGDPAELPAIAAAIARGLDAPAGLGRAPVAAARGADPAVPAARSAPFEPGELLNPRYVDDCAALLRGRDFAIWAGFGARRAAREIAAVAERTGAAVMCSPRGKGVFPEDHPQFVGVTGFGSHAGVKEYVSSARPERILVLGSRLGEFTSFWDPELVPRLGFVHVDLDPAVPGAAYPAATALAVQAEIGAFLRALLGRLDTRAVRPAFASPRGLRAPPRADGLIRPAALLDAVQRCVVEQSDAIVFTEAGNAFAWGSASLHFRTPGRYRTSTGWGSMGHATCGVIGAAKGRGGPAVALAGDGAMLMQTEVSTAVRYGIPAAWIVLNDSSYGMIEQGMQALGLRPLETEAPRDRLRRVGARAGRRRRARRARDEPRRRARADPHPAPAARRRRAHRRLRACTVPAPHRESAQSVRRQTPTGGPVMSASVGMRSLAISLPRTIRKNDFWRERYPSLVQKEEREDARPPVEGERARGSGRSVRARDGALPERSVPRRARAARARSGSVGRVARARLLRAARSTPPACAPTRSGSWSRRRSCPTRSASATRPR